MAKTSEFHAMLRCIVYGSEIAFGYRKDCNECEFKNPCDEVVEVYNKYKERKHDEEKKDPC